MLFSSMVGQDHHYSSTSYYSCCLKKLFLLHIILSFFLFETLAILRSRLSRNPSLFQTRDSDMLQILLTVGASATLNTATFFFFLFSLLFVNLLQAIEVNTQTPTSSFLGMMEKTCGSPQQPYYYRLRFTVHETFITVPVTCTSTCTVLVSKTSPNSCA